MLSIIFLCSYLLEQRYSFEWMATLRVYYLLILQLILRFTQLLEIAVLKQLIIYYHQCQFRLKIRFKVLIIHCVVYFLQLYLLQAIVCIAILISVMMYFNSLWLDDFQLSIMIKNDFFLKSQRRVFYTVKRSYTQHFIKVITKKRFLDIVLLSVNLDVIYSYFRRFRNRKAPSTALASPNSGRSVLIASQTLSLEVSLRLLQELYSCSLDRCNITTF